MDLFEQIITLSRQGFFCSQILMQLGMAATGREDAALVRAMGGLCGGLGFTGKVCGCLTGGCCLLSYYLGKGEADETEQPEARAAIAEFVRWFEERAKSEYGGDSCFAMTGNEPGRRLAVCPGLIADSYEKCMELLTERGAL
ncbi:MAG: C-GCAxxG-C-C family protein [Oscillospiraceae bacterium]|nr:C-GCAxxG-C-C family protein [Oscillospiraceae bacterium]